MAEKPVYIINGFLEAGKTVFIRTTLEDPEFINRDRTLLVVCEEGVEEYDAKALEKRNIFVKYVEDFSELTAEFYQQLDREYRPDKIIFELNGIWKTEDFLDSPMPREWIVVQMITIVNAATYQNYLNNMRSMIMEHLKYSDTVIFNRCTKETDRVMIRRTIKPLNRKAQIIYEADDGIDLGEEQEDPLPFDINTDPIVIEDDDYGLFYLDALDNPKHYEGKTISFKAQFYHDDKMPKGVILPGRFAMQCCANDIAFIGFMSKCQSSMKPFIDSHHNRDWIEVEAKLNVEFRREYKGRGPVLYITSIKDAEPAQEDVVYFT